MIKLVKGQKNTISLSILATPPVGEVHGTFIAGSVTKSIPTSQFGASFELTSDDVAIISSKDIIAKVNLFDTDENLVTSLLEPIEVLPDGSSNDGWTTIRTTLVYIREVEGESHSGGAVKMVDTYSDLPQPGNAKYVYLVKDTDKLYRWDDTSTETDKYVEVSKGATEVAITNGTMPTGDEKIWIDESETPDPVVLQSSFSGIEPLDKATLNTVEEKVNTILKKLKGE